MSSLVVLFNTIILITTKMTTSFYPESWVISAVKIVSASVERVRFIKRIPPPIFLWFWFGIFQNLLLFSSDSCLLSKWSLQTKYLLNCLVSSSLFMLTVRSFRGEFSLLNKTENPRRLREEENQA